MKELSIEDKAKRYDEAIEKAKEINREHSKKGFKLSDDVLFILPELKESEDERIRKELLEHCKNQVKPYIQTGNKCPQIQSWIAWLEKQGEQKAVEWSEEDDEMLKTVIEDFTKLAGSYVCYYKDIEWLKSLSPQSHWKPSKEQITALQKVVDEHWDVDGDPLWELSEQLKVL